jgi:hypothetical protein
MNSHANTFGSMRIALSFLLAAFTFQAALAQDSTAYVQENPKDKPMPFKERIWFGGGIGLSFGTFTAVQLDPLMGIHLDRNKKLSTGLGLSYWYFQDNSYIPALKQNVYGYRVFTRYRVIEQAFLHAEFLHLNAERYFNVDNSIRRTWIPHLLVGAGYVQPLAGRTSFYFQVLFEVLQDPNSLYFGQGPIISGGVGVGF